MVGYRTIKTGACLVFLLLCAGCVTYQVTSSPPNATVEYKSSTMIALDGLAPKTPCKVTKGLNWPYGFDYVAVKWSDGTFSDWRILDKDQHFYKNPKDEIYRNGIPDAPIVDYNFDAATHKGFISVDISKTGIGIRELVLRKIGHICSSSNVTLAAGEEELLAGGRYQILSENVKNNILTISFQAAY